MASGFIAKRLRSMRMRILRVVDPVIGLVGRIHALVPAVRTAWKGEVQAVGRHAVYVHYDRWGNIADYVHHALRELASNGYAVTFISNAPKLDEQQVREILPLVREAVHRRNVGYDFAAYRDGIFRLGDLDRVERLILMNDSVYGPIFPLADVLAKAEAADADVFGITESWEMRYHVQSYFVLFFPAALRSKVFRKFWRRFPTVGDKFWVIRNGEVKLSWLLARAKLKLSALCPYWDVSGRVLQQINEMDLGDKGELTRNEVKYYSELRDRIIAGKPINPSHYYWETLIRDWECPFIKRELIQANPVGVPRPWGWERLLREKSGYDTTLIRRHLQSL